jgi:hypothetical protein
MTNGQEMHPSIEEIRDLLSIAETEIKMSENITDQIVVPPINELRYAFSHLVTALTTGVEDSKNEHLIAAYKHCQRAITDALDIRSLYTLKLFNDFCKEYKFINISIVVPEFNEIQRNAFSLQDLLTVKPNTQNDFGHRISEMTRLTNELYSGIQRLEISRELFNKNLRLLRSGVLIALAVTAVTLSFFLYLGSLKISSSNPNPISVKDQFKSLDQVSSYLDGVRKDIDKQKVMISDLQRNISELNQEKDRLHKIVTFDRKTVDSIIATYEEKQHVIRWDQISISFIVGFLSSATFALFVWILRIRKRVIKD